FAYSPVLVLEAPVARGHLELESRVAGGDRLRRIERFDRAAQDLLCRISIDALSAFVPARNATVGVHEQDGVSRYAIDQEPVQLRVVEVECQAGGTLTPRRRVSLGLHGSPWKPAYGVNPSHRTRSASSRAGIVRAGRHDSIG